MWKKSAAFFQGFAVLFFSGIDLVILINGASMSCFFLGISINDDAIDDVHRVWVICLHDEMHP